MATAGIPRASTALDHGMVVGEAMDHHAVDQSAQDRWLYGVAPAPRCGYPTGNSVSATSASSPTSTMPRTSSMVDGSSTASGSEPGMRTLRSDRPEAQTAACDIGPGVSEVGCHGEDLLPLRPPTRVVTRCRRRTPEACRYPRGLGDVLHGDHVGCADSLTSGSRWRYPGPLESGLHDEAGIDDERGAP